MLLFGIGILSGACDNASRNQTFKGPNSKSPDPVFGERKFVIGDFNGDDVTDTLREEFISSITGEETNKYYKDISYDSLVLLTVRKKPFVKVCGGLIPPLVIRNDSWQILGLSLIEDMGDLNADGSDELGLVVEWADWSSVNSYNLYSIKSDQWHLVYSFEIRDWELEERNSGTQEGFVVKDASGNFLAHTWVGGDTAVVKIKF